MKLKPTGCVVENPSPNSVEFMGKHISLSAISRGSDISVSYLSRIFSGQRYPHIRLARKISSVLGLGVEDFYKGLDDRMKKMEEAADEQIAGYKERIRLEEEEDVAILSRGKVALPRNPVHYLHQDLD